MAHQVCRKFRCKLAAVFIAPKKFCCSAVLCYADNTEIAFRIICNILKIFACSCYNKYFADKCFCIKACRDCSDYIIKSKVFADLFFIKHIADVSAVSFIPTEAVHIGCGLFHFLNKWRG